MIRTSSSRNLRFVYSVLSIIILCLVLVSVWDASYIEDEAVEVSLREQYYDEVMAGTGQNYPVCGAIAALTAQLKLDESSRASEEKRYENLLHSGKLHCGNVRVGMGIFDRRYGLIANLSNTKISADSSTPTYQRSADIHLFSIYMSISTGIIFRGGNAFPKLFRRSGDYFDLSRNSVLLNKIRTRNMMPGGERNLKQ